MGHALVIVESPAKARTIEKYLGSGFRVEASVGHIRDLPRNASEIPAAKKGKAWSRLGVNIEEDFEPLYVVPSDKKSQVKKLKDALEPYGLPLPAPGKEDSLSTALGERETEFKNQVSNKANSNSAQKYIKNSSNIIKAEVSL